MKRETNLFLIVTIATLGWMVIMHLYSPKKIIQFELAGTIESATEIISDWKADGVALARTSTYLDFVFLVLYSYAISLGCKVASRFSGKKILQTIGNRLAILIWVAGLCDVIENIAMLKTLQEINQQTISVAYYFAAVKFGIVIISLLFILTASLIGLTKSKIGQNSESTNP